MGASAARGWLSEFNLVGLEPSRYEVGNHGFGRGAEFADGILNDPVRVGYALMLPEVLKPGRYHERLQKTPGRGHILEDIP